ncbi:alpha/beta hydrolase family protein [Ceratobasidium sp. AG-Ba]|nr:alpha/beta hydrolase family protein [Ceratobasidium sp. AG-Ba]
MSTELEPITELVPLHAGHTLELDIYSPPQDNTDARPAQKIAVLCHPWSWLGGCKDDPVLVNLAMVFAVTLGIHVFVPNSRGVGNSTGRSSFSGQAEAKDLEELVQWCVSRVGNVEYVIIAGYSHGSLLALCHPILPAPIRTYHILLSYPLSPLPLLTFFHASFYRDKLDQLAKDPRARLLILHGDRDQFTAIEKYTTWATSLQPVLDQIQETPDTAPVKVQVKVVPGADHFWRGRYNRQMRDIITSWLNEYEQVQQLS